MAKIELGILITGIRGTIAGTIFSANGAGPYAKVFAKSPNKRSIPQQSPRAGFSRFGTRWTSRTPAQRAAWNTYAALPAQQKTDSLGQTYNPSGFNYFVGMNMHRKTAALGVFDGPPTATVPAIIALTTIVVNKDPANTAVCTFASDPTPSVDVTLWTFLRMTQGALSSPIRSYLFAHLEPRGSGVNPITISNLDTLYGPIQAGQELFVIGYRQHPEGRRNAGTFIQGVAA